MKAVVWALVHSVWIGLLCAALAWLVITLTKKASAVLRYRLLCAILLVFVLATVYTLFREIDLATKTPVSLFVVKQPRNIITWVESYVDKQAVLLFALWVTIFVIKGFNIAGGLLYVRRLCRHKVQDAPEEIKLKIKQFGTALGIRHAFTILQSQLVKVPVVVRMVKPVILIPAGIFLQLPAEQLDGILWHELAHIYRRDYLINLLQIIVGSIFFFNPAVLWLSDLIRAEREACCDEIALAYLPAKTPYLEALLAFGNHRRPQAAFSLAFGHNGIRQRLERIAYRQNPLLVFKEKLVLCVCLVLLLAIMLLPHKMNVPYIAHMLFNQSNADIANSNIHIADDKGNQYYLQIADNSLAQLQINGRNIPGESLKNYQSLVAVVNDEMHQKKFKRALENSPVPNKPPLVNITDDRQRVLGVMGDLIKAHVIANRGAIHWFGLTETELVVNGNKQPATLQQKLKEAYGVKQNFGLYFGPVKMSGVGVFLDKGDL